MKPVHRRAWCRRRVAWLICWPAICLAVAYFGLPRLVPLPKGLSEAWETGQIVTDRDGRPLRVPLHEGKYRTEYLQLGDMPESLILSTLAAEDRRFWTHGGLDFWAIARAARDGLGSRRVVSGASTITQQLIKISSTPSRRSPWTKIHEALAARRLEMTWPKKRILEEYLNRLDYGNNCRGVGAATRYYFQKPPMDLSLSECALLAGLPQAPSRLNPLRHPQAAKSRRDWVLGRIAQCHASRDQEARRAKEEALVTRTLNQPFGAPHAVDLAIQLADDEAGSIETTIDGKLQAGVENALAAELARLEEAHVKNGAAVVLDNATGEVLALSGSGDFFSLEGGQINGALRPRSAGSTLKPFTYALALERGKHAAMILADVPTRYLGPTGLLDAANFDRRFRGPVSFREALANSLNIPALRLLNDIGGPALLYQRLRSLGLSSLNQPSDRYGLGLTIGNAEVRPLELCNAYACLARQGNYLSWKLLKKTPPLNGQALFSKEVAWLISDILSDNSARSGSFGMDSALRLPFPCACKTGTSTDFRDNWCLGYTPEFTVGVWMGNFDGTPMRGVSGGKGAALVFHEVMKLLAEKRPPSWYPRPEGLREYLVDRRTGALPSPGQTISPAFSRKEFFLASTPPSQCPAHAFDEQGRVLLPEAIYGEWWRDSSGTWSHLYGFEQPRVLAPEAPKFISPIPNATYLLDPELAGGGRTLGLDSSIGEAASWTCPSLRIDPKKSSLELAPGRHEIILTDARTGAAASAWITVEAR